MARTSISRSRPLPFLPSVCSVKAGSKTIKIPLSPGQGAFPMPFHAAQSTEEAWAFIKWMTSPEAALIEAQGTKAYYDTKDRRFVPGLSANRKTNDSIFKEFAPDRQNFGKR